MYVYVCMYVYTPLFIYAHTHTYIYIYIHMVCVGVCLCLWLCLCVCHAHIVMSCALDEAKQSNKQDKTCNSRQSCTHMMPSMHLEMFWLLHHFHHSWARHLLNKSRIEHNNQRA